MRTVIIFILSVGMASPVLANPQVAKRDAFEKEMMQFNYLELQEKAKENKTIERYLGYLAKKGVNDTAAFEQYKVKLRVHNMQKNYPRRWSETGHSENKPANPYE